ncbi:hypothetical protein [Roseovarius mucosus]|uniref:DUF6035 family protein n=1 Tax=Roseovarius mucosus TaxID=215743 RepID=UPI0035CF8BAC
MHSLQITDFHSPDILTPNTITHVIDRRDGTSSVVTARDMLSGLDAEGLALLRRSDHRHRQDGSPQFLCAFCGDPVHVRVRSVASSGHVDGRRAGFVHDPRPVPRDCPFASTSKASSPDAIDAIRFNGRQEGARHKQLKTRLCEMLLADKRIKFAECEVLVTGIGADGRATWRRPDVLTVTTDGRRLAFDVQIAAPLLTTIDGRERFYAAQGIAWHWIVDADQPRLLTLQGFQDLILPQASRVLGFNEQITTQAQQDNQSRFHLLHVQEDNDHRHFRVTTRLIGLEMALGLAGFPAGGPPPVATDLRALALRRDLRSGNDIRAARIFDLLAASCGTPDWTAARCDHVPEAITTLATLITGRKADASRFPDEAVSAIVNNFLRPDLSGQNSNLVNRSWAFAIAQIEDADPQVRQRIDQPRTKTRALLDAALSESAADPALSQRLHCTWSPLLQRLFPRLKA